MNEYDKYYIYETILVLLYEKGIDLITQFDLTNHHTSVLLLWALARRTEQFWKQQLFLLAFSLLYF